MSSNVPASLPTYRLRRAFHLGDRWARLNYALRLLEAGEEFQLSLPDSSAHEILEALQLDGLRERLQFGPPSSDEPSRELSRRIDRGAAAYNCRYFPTRQLHASPAQAIGYTFEANWRREEKIPPLTEALLSDLQTALPGWQLMPMGKPHQTTVTSLIAALAGVRLLLSVDNGVAHVARSVGTPLFLLEHLLSVGRGFPMEICCYTKVSCDAAIGTIYALLHSKLET